MNDTRAVEADPLGKMLADFVKWDGQQIGRTRLILMTPEQRKEAISERDESFKRLQASWQKS